MPELLYLDGTTGRIRNTGIELDEASTVPGSPASGWLWVNTGSANCPDGLYRHDGTRFLGEPQSMPVPFKPGLVVPLTATAARGAKCTRGHDLASIYVEKVLLRYKVTSANSGLTASHYWTYQFGGIDSADANVAFSTPSSTWQTARTPDTYYLDTLTVNTVYSNSVWGFYLDFTKAVGTPGNLDIDTMTMLFRYVGA